MISVFLLSILMGLVVALHSTYKQIRNFIVLRRNKLTFEGKVVWITGASSGIGEALAIKFSQLGANLILSSRNIKSLEEVKKKCVTSVRIVPMDLSNPMEARRIVEAFIANNKSITITLELDQPINILVHNAGVSQRSLFTDFSYENHEYMVNLNYNSPFAITQVIASHQIANNPKNIRNGSQIVVISSMAARLSPGYRSSYCSSKAALSALFDSIRAELHEDGVKVTQVFPGYIRSYGSTNALTEKAGERYGGTDDDQKKSMDMVIQNEHIEQNVFVERCIRTIFLEENETYICSSRTHIIGVYLKELMPELYYRLAANHFKKSQKIAESVKQKKD